MFDFEGRGYEYELYCISTAYIFGDCLQYIIFYNKILNRDEILFCMIKSENLRSEVENSRLLCVLE